MNPLVTLLIIIAVALIGYFVPKKYNEYFYSEYHAKAVSIPLAVITAIFSSLWIIFMDLEGFWYWFLLIASIVLCIASIIYAICVGIDVRATAFEIAFAVIAQILAIIGVIILIIGIFAFVMQMLGGKKRRRR